MFVVPILLSLGMSCCSTGSTPSSLQRPLLYGTSEALAKKPAELYCEVPNHPPDIRLQLHLYKVGDRDWLLGESTSQDGEVGVFPMMISVKYEGLLECVAEPQNKSSSNLTASVSSPHYLKVVEPVKGAQILYSSPLDFFEGETLELQCGLTAGNHASYRWLLEGQPIHPSPRHHVSGDHLQIFRTSSADSGSYRCVATNTFNNTQIFTANSPDITVTVRDLVSGPDISFTVLKEDPNSYWAVVTCQVARGAPPITFSLSNGTRVITSVTADERRATFRVPVVLNQHSRWIQCRANNSQLAVHSRWIPLEVVPVRGPVVMSYDYDLGENYAVVGLRFSCRAAAGSHPQYRWFLNGTMLKGRGSFFLVVDRPPEPSLLLLSVGGSSCTGSYHCEVSDSFDNSTAVASRGRYINKEVLNRLSFLVVLVVFGCFSFILLLVCVCCWLGVLFRWRLYGEKSLLSLEMERPILAYEGEMDLKTFSEDPDVLEATREAEFDQISEVSVDEQTQTVKQEEEKEEEEKGEVHDQEEVEKEKEEEQNEEEEKEEVEKRKEEEKQEEEEEKQKEELEKEDEEQEEEKEQTEEKKQEEKEEQKEKQEGERQNKEDEVEKEEEKQEEEKQNEEEERKEEVDKEKEEGERKEEVDKEKEEEKQEQEEEKQEEEKQEEEDEEQKEVIEKEKEENKQEEEEEQKGEQEGERQNNEEVEKVEEKEEPLDGEEQEEKLQD